MRGLTIGPDELQAVCLEAALRHRPLGGRSETDGRGRTTDRQRAAKSGVPASKIGLPKAVAPSESRDSPNKMIAG